MARSPPLYSRAIRMLLRRLAANLYAQVLIAIAIGLILGAIAPGIGAAMRPLGDGFIKLIKMLIGPIVFSTVVTGIARMAAMREVGRIGLRALLYFEVVSTVALVIGLVVVRVVQPGADLHIDPSTLNASAVSAYAAAGKTLHLTHLTHLPSSRRPYGSQHGCAHRCRSGRDCPTSPG